MDKLYNNKEDILIIFVLYMKYVIYLLILEELIFLIQFYILRMIYELLFLKYILKIYLIIIYQILISNYKIANLLQVIRFLKQKSKNINKYLLYKNKEKAMIMNDKNETTKADVLKKLVKIIIQLSRKKLIII